MLKNVLSGHLYYNLYYKLLVIKVSIIIIIIIIIIKCLEFKFRVDGRFACII